MKTRRKQPPSPLPIEPDQDFLARESVRAAIHTAVRESQSSYPDRTTLTSVPAPGASQLCRARYALPRFQRGAVWSPEAAVAFVEALSRHQVVAPMLLWERWGEPTLVLDGQQRLLALGTPLKVRGEAEVRVGARAYWDVPQRKWVPEWVAGRYTVYDLMGEPADLGTSHWVDGVLAGQYGPEDVAVTLRTIWALQRHQPFSITVLRGEATLDEARQVFRNWNLPGAPFDPGEIDNLVREVD